MGRTFSPLRYPGGKTSITSMISDVIERNFTTPCRYIEPYAGGGGLALSLLFSGKVMEIHLNDLDRSIWAVWHSMLNELDAFIDKINKTEITINEWHKQRDIQNNKEQYTDLEVGFSSFFLNRTNRSGIILKAGVIGGLLQENEKYKMDCRFNKSELIKRIIKINSYKDRIHIYNNDAVAFMTEMEKIYDNVCFFIDPPYYEKGASLYTNFYSKEDHAKISDVILKLKNKWILTYDDADKIRELYSEHPSYEFYLNYSLAIKRVGTELFFSSKDLEIPEDIINNLLVPITR
ncbi:DNA adenine methylase [Yokenella regensburgei]|uniref:DNA adenine methylase n=1 Tax=Yokenella regensburgei TaxID=158877 RepID=UPI002077286C|nr:DNA adenine methylase [Yokenella regensburgei]